MTDRMHYEHYGVVWLQLGSPDREPLKINGEHATMVGDFLRWLLDEEVYPARGMVSGGGVYEGLIWAEDWPKVEKWLKENGFKYGPTEKKREKYWAEYEKMGG